MSSLPPHPVLRALLPLVLALAGLTAVPAPAQAAVQTLCEGYKTCNQAGMSHAGYAKAGSTMYWRMYAGHNCTNYVAYRMVQSGMPNVRPWEGGGNATYWGSHMSSITDQTPTVGSVAWWKAGVYPAGSAGHVAYVEQVLSPDEIIVSQDSWGGDFSWARVTKGSRGWPSGFIHFNDESLVNVAKPALTGTPKVGAVLTADPGSWDPGDIAAEYRWFADGTRLAGASGSTLSLDESLLGARIKVRVFASKLGYTTARATSAATPAVLPGTITSTAPPTIEGTSTVDQTLSVTPGGWNPQPDAISYQWFADGDPVAGADTSRLLLTPALVGRDVTVQVTATREGFDPVVARPAARTVAPGRLTVSQEPDLAGEGLPGRTLRLTAPQTVEQSTGSVRWFRGARPVEGANGWAYDVTTADVGKRISAEVTLERPGYTSLVRRVVSRRVRVPADLRVDAERAGRRGGKVTLRVHALPEWDVEAPGVAKVKALGAVKTKKLRDGSARMTLRKVPRKAFRVKVIHPQTPLTERSVEVIRVRRR